MGVHYGLDSLITLFAQSVNKGFGYGTECQNMLQRAAYSVNETLEILPIGRTKLYDLMNHRKLRKVKVGKKTLILASDIQTFLEGLVAEAS